MNKPRNHLLRIYRLAMLVAIAWVVRDHHERIRITGDVPVQLAEVKALLPDAMRLELDLGPRMGWRVENADGALIGYAVRTQPHCRDIIGYCGITDTLIAFDDQWRVKGVRVRSSEDTVRHVEDVVMDRHFLKTWNRLEWDRVAQLDLQRAGIEGVSGATQTSLAIARAISRRLALAEPANASPNHWRVGGRDWALLCILVVAGLICFVRVPHYQGARRGFQVVVVLYVGFLSGDMLAQSLFGGWARTGVNWQMALGVVLLAAAAFLIPWTMRRPFYCHQVCPYGVLQEWTGRLWPARFRLRIPNAVDRQLRRLPAALLLVILVTVMWKLPLDLADFEPFDAFLLKTAGGMTLALFVAGLVAALFVPQAYCHYGCPTGALLEFVRSRGSHDRFGIRDWFALAMLLAAVALARNYEFFAGWLDAS